MVVLAVDPSFSAFGYVVIDTKGDIVLNYGCVKTKPDRTEYQHADDVFRAAHIADVLVSQIKQYKVREVWLESFFGSKSFNAVRVMGVCKGLVVGLARSRGLKVKFLNAVDIRTELVGLKSNDKADVAEWVFGQYPGLQAALAKASLEVTYAVTDSVAVYQAVSRASSWFEAPSGTDRKA